MRRDFRCFPAVEFKAVAIGTSGLLKGKRLTIEKRVVTGSWRRADGTRGVNYSYWATYDTVCCGVPMVGYACVPASECAVLSIVVRQERQAAA